MTGLALWHYSPSSHRSTERCPIWDFKNPSQCQSDQRHVRAHFRGTLLKPGHPDPSRTPFLTERPGLAPLTSRWPPKTGLQALGDHQAQPRQATKPQLNPKPRLNPPSFDSPATSRGSSLPPSAQASPHHKIPIFLHLLHTYHLLSPLHHLPSLLPLLPPHSK
ncbi:hypothetical protein CRG98_016479 [Punica granatum]|uniref:Uncharacterized protein n=1 Tax=Punica granatum TaxID=22663 RepID=A0A2I0K3M1_PUNGR|nr:hypothetical protein CRG98_016479 [Punica granatum]